MSVKVTVLMPAYNAGKYIAESIQSVIDQTYSDWELLIVNDGSTDDTAQVVRRFNDPRIRLIENPTNLGLIKTLNHGLEEANGELIARLDADDLASPDRLQLQTAYLHSNPECALLGTRSRTIDSDGAIISERTNLYRHAESNEGLLWESVFFNPIRHSSAMFRKNLIWNLLGGYPIEAKHLEDFALWSRVMDKALVANLPEYTCDYRVHQSSVMSLAKSAAASALTDPRRKLAKEIFYNNARRCNLPKNLAKEWSLIWPVVQYPLNRDKGCLPEARRRFCEVIKCRPVYSDRLRQEEVGRVIARGVFKLARRLRSEKLYWDLVQLYACGLSVCGSLLWRAYIKVIIRKFRK